MAANRHAEEATHRHFSTRGAPCCIEPTSLLASTELSGDAAGGSEIREAFAAITEGMWWVMALDEQLRIQLKRRGVEYSRTETPPAESGTL